MSDGPALPSPRWRRAGGAVIGWRAPRTIGVVDAVGAMGRLLERF